MREKIYKIINKLYGVLMTVSFFGGALPLVAYIVAMIIGGSIGEKIAVFASEEFYPYVFALASIAVVVGLIAMYVGKQEGLSVKSFGEKKDEDKDEKAK